MATQLLAYHNRPELKEQFVEEMERHRMLDMIQQGETGTRCEPGLWKGCHVACAVHSMSLIDQREYHAYSHDLWPDLLGLPTWMAHLCEHIFEGLPSDEAVEFTIAFSKAVKCGKDCETIATPLCLWFMSRIPAVEDPECTELLATVEKVLQADLNGETADSAAWRDLYDNAWRLYHVCNRCHNFRARDAAEVAAHLIYTHGSGRAVPLSSAACVLVNTHGRITLARQLRDKLLELVAE